MVSKTYMFCTHYKCAYYRHISVKCTQSTLYMPIAYLFSVHIGLYVYVHIDIYAQRLREKEISGLHVQ